MYVSHVYEDDLELIADYFKVNNNLELLDEDFAKKLGLEIHRHMKD